MSLNWIEIDQVLAELPLENSHIQKIRQPDFHTLVLEIYHPGNRFKLLISLTQGKTRLHRTDTPPRTDGPLQRFAQFLRSRIQGGRIIHSSQLGQERIVLLTVQRAGEITHIYIRLWGGASNILATDEGGTILDCFYRRPRRGEVSGGSFNPEALVKPSQRENSPFVSRFDPEKGGINAQVENHYSRLEDGEELTLLIQRVERVLNNREGALRKSLQTARERQEKYENPEGYKEFGDLLMTYLYKIEKGARWVTVEDYYNENREVRIELDPTLSPEKNAEAYYKRAAKARGGRERVAEETANITSQLTSLEEQRKTLLENPDLNALRDFLAALPAKQEAKSSEKIPGLQFTSRGFTIYVGRTAKENDALLRRHVRGNDTWLHARDYPGAYVFIRAFPGKSIPLEVLLDAGNLALFYSKARSGGRGELYYTQVKYLRRAKDGPLGLVLPTQEKNLSVVLEEPRLRRLQNPGEPA
jgi:predicted ribosome quality control (RQC) complex YloA/Tae2 family protein